MDDKSLQQSVITTPSTVDKIVAKKTPRSEVVRRFSQTVKKLFNTPNHVEPVVKIIPTPQTNRKEAGDTVSVSETLPPYTAVDPTVELNPNSVNENNKTSRYNLRGRSGKPIDLPWQSLPRIPRTKKKQIDIQQAIVNEQALSQSAPSAPTEEDINKIERMTNSKEEEFYVDPYYEEIPAGDEPKRIFNALKAAGLDSKQAHRVTLNTLRHNDEKFKDTLKSTAEEDTAENQFLDIQRQQQAISLLQSLNAFSGSSPVDGLKPVGFKQWVRQFEAIVKIAKWTEESKVNLLSTKLTDLAADALEEFFRKNKGRQTYEVVKKFLIDRFHSNETRQLFVKEYKECRREAGETIIDFAWRLKKLFSLAYPQIGNQSSSSAMDSVLMDKFIEGLPFEIRYKVKHKEFARFDDLVKVANKFSNSYDEERREKDERKLVAQIKHVSYQTEPQIMGEMRELKMQTQAILEEMKQVAAFQSRQMYQQGPTEPNQTPWHGQQRSPFPSYNGQNQFQNQGSFRSGATRQGRVNNQRKNYNPSAFCEYCNTPGHFRNECRQYLISIGACFHCQQTGHVRAQCPVLQRSQQQGPNIVDRSNATQGRENNSNQGNQ